MLKPGQITMLLSQHREGDGKALQQLLPLVYDTLRRMARAKLRGERSDHTLSATALVNEAFLKLGGYEGIPINDRVHFFAIAGNAMRRILVDYARERKALKRGGDAIRVAFDDAIGIDEGALPQVLVLDEALEMLAKTHERASRVVELRYFAGLTAEEIAEVLQVSVPTVRKDWAKAKLWLYQTLSERD